MQNDVADQVVIFEPDNSLNIVLFKKVQNCIWPLGSSENKPRTNIVTYGLYGNPDSCLFTCLAVSKQPLH